MFNPQQDYNYLFDYQRDKSKFMENKLHMSDLELVESHKWNGSVLIRTPKNESYYMEEAADDWMESIDNLDLASVTETPKVDHAPRPIKIYHPLDASGNVWIIGKWDGNEYKKAQITADELLNLDLSNKNLERLARFGHKRPEVREVKKKKKHGFFGWF